MKDATHQRQIHQGWLDFAREFQGSLPTPGLMNRLPVNGQNIPGRGEEDIAQNTTANLHSMMVMTNYYSVDLVVSPVERNPNVRVCGAGEYNFEAYNPVEDAYWDPDFKADLSQLSHVSFAHMPIHGARKSKQWRTTMDAKFSVLSSRGPKDGAIDPSSMTCGPHGNWAGNVTFQDNHIEFFNSTQWADPSDAAKTDNFFATDEQGLATDMLLAFTREITPQGPELQFD